MGLRLTEYWRSCGLCLVKIAQSVLVFTKSLKSDRRAVDVDPSGIATYSVAVRTDTAASLESFDGLFCFQAMLEEARQLSPDIGTGLRDARWHGMRNKA